MSTIQKEWVLPIYTVKYFHNFIETINEERTVNLQNNPVTGNSLWIYGISPFTTISATVLNHSLNKEHWDYLIFKNNGVIVQKWRIFIYENESDCFVKIKNGLKIRLIKR